MDESCLNILDAIRYSVRDALGGPPSGAGPGSARHAVGIAFSGGVDSTLLAVVCGTMGYKPVLLTVGFEASHDVAFSREVASVLRMDHAVYVIPGMPALADAYASVRDVVRTDNLSWLENAVAFCLVSRLARDSGIATVVTANGIDELFCGYDAYRRAIVTVPPESRDAAIRDLMRQKLANELRMFGSIRDLASGRYGVDILNPLLSEAFCDAAHRIPTSDKITGPDDVFRKHVIRRLAAGLGAPGMSCMKRKKALQYGTGIHKALLKLRRREAAGTAPC